VSVRVSVRVWVKFIRARVCGSSLTCLCVYVCMCVCVYVCVPICLLAGTCYRAQRVNATHVAAHLAVVTHTVDDSVPHASSSAATPAPPPPTQTVVVVAYECDLCHVRVDPRAHYRCPRCPDYDICDACFRARPVSVQHDATHWPAVTQVDPLTLAR
jgi:hypothetical protein